VETRGVHPRGKEDDPQSSHRFGGGLKTPGQGFRYSEKGTGREMLSVNIYAIQKGQKEDLNVKENDIIIVPRHGVKAFFVGVKETLTGVFSIGYGLGTL